MNSTVQILNNIYTDTSASLSLTSTPWILITGSVSSSTTAPGGGRSDFSGWINTEGYTELHFVGRYDAGSLSISNGQIGLMASDNGTTYIGGSASITQPPLLCASAGGVWSSTSSGFILDVGGGVNSGYSAISIAAMRHITQGCILPKYVKLGFYYAAGAANDWRCVWSLYGKRA
jgi:hypothetical protein